MNQIKDYEAYLVDIYMKLGNKKQDWQKNMTM